MCVEHPHMIPVLSCWPRGKPPQVACEAATPAMRARPLLGNSMPAWAVSTPLLQRDASKPPVYALGRVRRRGWLPSAQAQLHSPHGEEGGREGGRIVGRNELRRMSSPLYAGEQPGMEDSSCENVSLKHEEGSSGDASRREQLPSGEAMEEDAVSDDGHREDVEERKRGARLSPVQVQQQAIVNRLRTLETRRDWRGVLAAMVS